MRIRAVIAVVIIVAVVLFWGAMSIYDKGYAAAEAIYQKKAIRAAMCKIENTETLENQKQKLKQREANLNADCKALYSVDLSACRRQLRGQH